MYGAAAAIASLAHEPLCPSTICSPDAPILQYCADNGTKSATPVLNCLPTAGASAATP
jgi:hypothetical protein